MIRAALAGLALLTASAAGAQDQDQSQSPEGALSGRGAVLRGLDKVNGQTVDVELGSGSTDRVLGLEVELADCRYPADNPTGDAFAFMVIRDPNKVEALFSGWMIASAPALNALDHNRYDIWVIRCITS